ncbi:hypothetical protein [Limoniibacter endophyticus]|uniref:Uncharacterized protein n=1 Tax=Limoniibacter endophyticus TaxID=1565040 RepID=A0A8J3DJU1_9HYPH|nr:hypothetical protein [Limoniibacter endophyticus]GHC79596.1 hypothetical protein GCM10010136_32290 [Limoniibacter endophyticus]
MNLSNIKALAEQLIRDVEGVEASNPTSFKRVDCQLGIHKGFGRLSRELGYRVERIEPEKEAA